MKKIRPELRRSLSSDQWKLMVNFYMASHGHGHYLILHIAYKERLTMPKVVMSATGDEFFLPDDSHMFFDELPEPKWMLWAITYVT